MSNTGIITGGSSEGVDLSTNSAFNDLTAAVLRNTRKIKGIEPIISGNSTKISALEEDLQTVRTRVMQNKTNIVQMKQSVDINISDISKLKENQEGVQFKGEVFNASNDKILFEDDFGKIGWEAGNTKQCYYIPNNGWSWHDGVAMLINGQTGDTILSATDDRSSTANGSAKFYFTPDGTISEEFKMNNFGGYFMGTIIKESHALQYPAYKVELLMGNTGSGAVILTKIKNDINI